MTTTNLGYDSTNACLVGPAEGGDPAIRATFLGLMMLNDELVAVVHFDGQVMLDTVEPTRVTLVE